MAFFGQADANVVRGEWLGPGLSVGVAVAPAAGAGRLLEGQVVDRLAWGSPLWGRCACHGSGRPRTVCQECRLTRLSPMRVTARSMPVATSPVFRKKDELIGGVVARTIGRASGAGRRQLDPVALSFTRFSNLTRLTSNGWPIRPSRGRLDLRRHRAAAQTMWRTPGPKRAAESRVGTATRGEPWRHTNRPMSSRDSAEAGCRTWAAGRCPIGLQVVAQTRAPVKAKQTRSHRVRLGGNRVRSLRCRSRG